jgi:Xaa-Pro aminopeptidase
MKPRIKNFLSRLKQENLDGFIISLPENISYLAEFNCCDAYLLVSPKETFYFTDSRHTEAARLKLKTTKITLKKINGSVFELISDTCRQMGLKRVGFEERHLPYAEYKKIKENLKTKVYLVPTHNLIENLRQIKEPGELEKIKEALKITGSAFDFIGRFIKPGIKELEVAAELERFIRYNGASQAAFDIIVASGPNSAYPHHAPGQRKIQKGEPLLIDVGVDYMGYKSDLTRVFFLDKINSLTRRIYDIVLKAQSKAINGIKPGIEIARIDALARNYIERCGFAKYFGHSLGHGIGLETHEAPSISAKNEGLLVPGMVFTVEPAIYLTNKFGIRIEDMVLVTKKGCEVLSGAINK